MATYGVTFDIDQQPTYDRTQVAIRVVIIIVLSILGGVLGWVHGLLYLAVPVLAAIMISQKGAATYFAESDGNMKRWLRYGIGFYSYMAMLTDKLPNDEALPAMRLSITPSGEPTAGHVLLRIILAIPHAIVLALLGFVAGILVLVAAVMVLVNETYPHGVFKFLRGYVRWNARLYGYLAGFVQDYPPFALDTGSEAPPDTRATQGDGSQAEPSA